MPELPPFVLLYLGALLAALTRGRLRQIVLLLAPLLSALQMGLAAEGVHWRLSMLGFELVPWRVDSLSLLFGLMFHVAGFLGIVFSLHLRDTLQHVAALLYLGSAIGAVFAGDLLTLFMFWEMLALSSALLIWARRSDRAYHAGMRYLVLQLISGLLLLAGALLHARTTGSLEFGFIGLQGASGALIFCAFGIKCAFPLVHNWLTDAYPESTPTGAVFLSALTTKVAVYALARGFPGTELLIYIGAVMTCFPIFYAVIENDLRRVLAYSLVNQLGFMVCGIGVGTALALNGATAHAFCHVIYKSLLFMAMGAVLQMSGRIGASELGGLYRRMPKTTACCLVGAASISAFPLFSGFVSKSMVMTAVLEAGYGWVWLALLFASAGVFHHAGIKIPYFAFFARDRHIDAADPPFNMRCAMALAALLCLAIGLYPAALYSLLPFDTGYHPYNAAHVLAQLQLLCFSALAFIWLNRRSLYPQELPAVNLDAEWVYRRGFPGLWLRIVALAGAGRSGVRSQALRCYQRCWGVLERYSRYTQSQPLGLRVFTVIAVLALVLALALLR